MHFGVSAKIELARERLVDFFKIFGAAGNAERFQFQRPALVQLPKAVEMAVIRRFEMAEETKLARHRRPVALFAIPCNASNKIRAPRL